MWREKEQQLIDDLGLLAEWTDRYEYIIDRGRDLDAYPDALRTEDREVHGCQSQVWLDARFENGRLYFRGDSNALITRGLVALLIDLFSGCTPRELIDASLEFVERAGLREHLTPSRSNGLQAVFKRMKQHAAVFENLEPAT